MRFQTPNRIVVAQVLAAVVLLVTGWLIYQPALPGFFLLDDFDNLEPLRDGVVLSDPLSVERYLATGNAGPLGRPVAKLSFLLNDNAWPSAPAGFKRTNLLIHLLIGVVLLGLLRSVLRAGQEHTGRRPEWIALIVVAIWLCHPLNVSTTMYVIQRMTQLSMLFVCAGMWMHVWLRTRDAGQTSLVALSASLAGFGTLAALSKESGVLLPVYLLVLETTILSRQPTTIGFVWWRRLFVYAPSAALIAYLLYIPRWIGSYASRDFSLAERLLTQPVVLLDYLGHIGSLRVYGLGLFQDDYPVRESLADPLVAGALLAIIVAVGVAVHLRKRAPVASLGILWFFVGHMLESSTVALELYFEHRNYLPMVGIILLVASGASWLLRRAAPSLPWVPAATGVAFWVIASLTTATYAADWGNQLRLMTTWSAQHPESPRAQRTFAHTLAANGNPALALHTLDWAHEQFPTDLSVPVLSIGISCAFDLPARFDLSDLADDIESYAMTDGLRPALQSLQQMYTDMACDYESAKAHDFLKTLDRLPGEDVKPRHRAAFALLDGRLYLAEQDGNGAEIAFLRIDRLDPTIDSALRLSDFYRAINYPDLALEWAMDALKRAERSSTRFGKLRAESIRSRIERLE